MKIFIHYFKFKVTVFVLSSFLSFLITFNPLFAQNETNRELEVKALFIHTFTRYIEWQKLESDDSFIIGIIGETKLIPSLEKIANNKQAKNKKIIITRYSILEEIEKCHILFIGNSEENNLDKILTHVRGKSILTIGDTKDFAKKGVCINFIRQKGRVKFELNRSSTNENKLEVSSKLLKLAALVE